MTRSEASRLNGAKSKGPITEQGKARSAQNSYKHGLASPMLVLRHESDETYCELCEEYGLEFDPKTPAESDLVYEIAASTWRIRRLHSTETLLLDAEIELRRGEVAEQWNNPDDQLPKVPQSSPDRSSPNEPQGHFTTIRTRARITSAGNAAIFQRAPRQIQLALKLY
jgi:hypothetical protein